MSAWKPGGFHWQSHFIKPASFFSIRWCFQLHIFDPPKADRAQTASLTQTIAIKISMRHLQRTFSPVARSFSSGPLRLSNPALAQQPSDIMVRKEKRSESSPDVDKNAAESESLPPLSMKDFQVFNRMAVQMDQFVSRPLTPLKPKNKQVLIRFPPSITISV